LLYLCVDSCIVVLAPVLQAAVYSVHPDTVAQQITQLTAGPQLQAFAQSSAHYPEQQQMLADLQAVWAVMQAAQEVPAHSSAHAPAQQQMLADLQAIWMAMQAVQEEVSAQGPAQQHVHSPTMAAAQEGSAALLGQELLPSEAQQQEQLLREQLVLQVMQFAARQGSAGGF
jgi:hypothetical protein